MVKETSQIWSFFTYVHKWFSVRIGIRVDVLSNRSVFSYLLRIEVNIFHVFSLSVFKLPQ